MILLICLLSISLYVPPEDSKISSKFDGWLDKRSPESLVKVWVYFTDKGIFKQSEYKEAVELAEESLTPKARGRRLRVRRVGELCDFDDLPVCKKYINELSELGCRFKGASKWLNAASFVVRVEKIPEITKKVWVRKVEPIRIFYASKDATRTIGLKGINYGYSERQLKQINVTEAHKMGYTGKGILIGILDTGFEWRRNRALKEIDIVAEYDFIGNDTCTAYEPEQIDTIYCPDTVLYHNEEEDQIRHGTAMLTLLGARCPGESGFIGAAFDASFALAKTELPENPYGAGTKDIIAEEDWWIIGAEWLDSVGVDLISNSLGYREWYDSSTFAYDSLNGKCYPMSIAASKLWENGVLLVTALGNRWIKTALPESSIVAPADADSILAVGGVDTLGNWIYWEDVGNIHMGGIKGPRCDGATKPEVCGPWIGEYGIPYPYPDYDSLQHLEGHGTSCAAVLVAGACALVLEADTTLGPMDIRWFVMKTATHASSPNDSLGYGIVNAKKAILKVPDRIPKPEFDRDRLLSPYPSPFRPGERKELKLPYQLVNNSYVHIRIYTISGKLIKEMDIGEKVMGSYEVSWDGKSGDDFVGSGIYICLLETGYGKDVKKFAVVK